MNINLEYIKTFCPCEEFSIDEYVEAGHEKFNGTVLDFLNLKGVSIENKLCVILTEEIIPENDLHELACKFAESVLHLFEKEYPTDKRPRLAIDAKRKYIKGEITKHDLDAAWDAAWAAAWAVTWDDALDARAAAWDAAWAATWAAAWDARDAAWDSAKAAAWAAARTARDAEKQKQLKIVKDYLKKV